MEHISLAHGDGGELTNQLITSIFVKAFGNIEEAKHDAAKLKIESKHIAFTTDSFIVKPLFFPGGNIGKLAVAGTVNDLAVSGAVPKYLSASFIIEEGFLIQDLKSIVFAMAKEAEKAGVRIITGDTKVVEKGAADGIFINTTGIGVRSCEFQEIQEGDSVIINGPIGDHGVAILTARRELGLKTKVMSDCASLNKMIQRVVGNLNSVKAMRDLTRGGLATALVELCENHNVTVELDELNVPIRNEVYGACDILGYDPFYLANEGKIAFIVAKEEEENLLNILKQFSEGVEAKVIGSVKNLQKGALYLKTPIGSKRRVERLSGLMLPRIC